MPVQPQAPTVPSDIAKYKAKLKKERAKRIKLKESHALEVQKI
jgi:hypothetical protein